MSTTTITSVRTHRPPTGQTAGARGSRLALPIILTCYLMIVLDASIVITALPKIHAALGFSSAGLSWVQNAYTLSFGGLLLLGARAGDILGRRLAFLAGIALFTTASMAAGLAESPIWLLSARAAQGIGAALAAPSTLALLMTRFPEGHERTRALALYSAVAGAGASIGLVVGGMLTAWVSWRWSLFINVPIGATVIWLAPRHLPETERMAGRFDLTGAATSTLGMTALVYGFVRAASDGWGDRVTLTSFTAGAGLVAAFVLTEMRAEHPITPLRLFASRERVGAYLARILLVGGMFGMFFFVTQFLQSVRGYSPLEAGVAFLPMTLALFGMVRALPRVALRVGDRRLLAGGLFVALVGMTWLSGLSTGTPYFPDIVGPLVLLGIGLGAAFTPLTTAGMAGVAPHDTGAASGLVNVAHQLGGSLGLGILVTIFAAAGHTAAQHPVAGASTRVEAAHVLTQAVSTSVTAAAIFLAFALAIVVVTLRPSAVALPAIAEPEGLN